MTTWRCPHCRTPQQEASRCWVCGRSSTICSTCRWYRRSVAGGVGYCGMDARRAPLRGDELRPCWAPAELEVEVGGLFAQDAAPAGRGWKAPRS